MGQSKDVGDISNLILGTDTPLKMQYLGYGPDSIEDVTVDSAYELSKHLNKHQVNWINLPSCSTAVSMQPLAELFQLHELALEDALNFHQRSKVEDYKHHLFIVLRVPTGDINSCDTEQLAIFLGKDFVITFQEKDGGDCLEPLRDRIRKGVGSLRTMGADYLAYSIVDAGVDAYFPILERLGERIESLDEVIISDTSNKATAQIHEIKLEVLAIRRAVWPMRDAINSLCRDTTPFITEGTRVYMRDCYDHLSRIIDLIEMYRELSTDLLNIYLSSVNNRMNEIIKVLTIITSLFIPPTLIAGIYGMNFRTDISPFNMPELNWYFGYPVSILLMLLTSGAMLVYLRKRRWL
ncbi:MAG: magnesium/cobalt transporter CorA [Candidatus Obscuribacterales bacterium]|nr:magnesium/cobalt transporter CorA [Candidatus Obscuribacterales bacterium]